ncbi:histidinol-phosphate transaminase [Aliiglaciecola sp. CAU 1673]|uniref:histidinol-phosphate transaminase n=1 Tax=Aliiglaciecola sp. CAU 1673 TaxID=3032595 RepID=UPI0023DA1B68|nr:histidinol-phosphate transaminase [Aliiglaciecola sp. CAU 1673]MDF2179538.1 histidinol-phosphate transaminase [Aliiglaciecola sp. CAU 1673]
MSANKLVNKLLCAHLQSLEPYQSARRLISGGQDWLNANESPYANDFELDCSRLNRYPDCQPKTLINAYAQYTGVDSDKVLVSRGADEAIELLIRAFCTPGQDKVLICPPTYGMYAISAKTFNVGVVEAPLLSDFSLDLDAVQSVKGQVNLVFLCSPNNPTGTVLAKAQVQAVLEHFADSALVVLDEAYIEFADENYWASQLGRYPNLVILRTLSKAFGLAGIRCGFALANTDIIQALLKVIAPYPLPQPVAQIAEQALSAAGLERTTEQVSTLKNLRSQLAQALAHYPQLVPVGSDKGNFLLVRTNKRQALMTYLIARGILIRDQSKQRNLEDCLRISIGNQEQNQRLLAALDSFFMEHA